MASSTIRKREIRTALRERADAWQREFFRHELLTARYVRGVQLEAEADFQRRVVRPLLFELPAKLAAVRARGDDYTRDMFPAMASMLDDISRTIAKGADAAGKLTAKRMAEIAEREVEWTASALKRAAPEVKAEVGRELGKDAAGEAAQGTKDRIWLGDTTERVFARDLGEKTGEAVRRTITTAQKHGLSVDGTVKLLRGSPGKSGILAEKPVYTIRGLVRSAATHASSEGRMASYRALGVTHWRFIATLDQRTTIQCASEDGNTYPLDEGPIPPLHANCRSSVSPVIEGLEPFGTRASIKGPVSAKTNFEEWLAQLPEGEQEMVLGKTKARAWRAGKLKLKDMLGKDLQPLTLAELEGLDLL